MGFILLKSPKLKGKRKASNRPISLLEQRSSKTGPMVRSVPGLQYMNYQFNLKVINIPDGSIKST